MSIKRFFWQLVFSLVSNFQDLQYFGYFPSKQPPSNKWQTPQLSKEFTNDVTISQAKKYHRSSVESPIGKTTTLNKLLQKLERARKKANLPEGTAKAHSYPSYWESGATLRTLRSRRRQRAEIDRKVAQVRKGVMLNKLPDDLMGNFQSTYRNLQYYLGRVNAARKMKTEGKTDIVYIPTGVLCLSSP